ncbi:MAG: hypothetical protein KGO81_03950 [Bacteroidota bacterium]|nr:hypothetical protein [Bacteroidota bacterium]
MKKLLAGLWYSLPVQLFLLHFRRYQVFLIFWYILFATIAGHFLKPFGAESLFLAPEYFNEVNAISTAIVGFAIGVFIMSWNITTFILHAKQIKFLATTSQPFLKYCINNALLPLIFIVFYAIRGFQNALQNELVAVSEVLFSAGGFAIGLFLSVLIAFVYFFGADKTIYRSIGTVMRTANTQYEESVQKNPLPKEKAEIEVRWFLSARLKLRKCRDVRHYSPGFLDNVFTRHHVAAVIAIMIAFMFLLFTGYTSDTRLFQIPAAASITVLFAVLIAVSGAVSLFFGNWSIVLILAVYLFLDFSYQKEWIDPRNKAYGLDYQDKTNRPVYNRAHIMQMASIANMEKDKLAFLKILNIWKARQKEKKPVLYVVNTSGGGVRSAVFTMNALQRLDSIMHGELMKKTLFINGSSGGLLGAAYFRELYYQKELGKNINLQDPQYVDDISKDLLNPLFSSYVTRDIVGPVQKFTYNDFKYAKDRGYAFEEKLNDNTHGLLDKPLKAYAIPEENATIPFMFFNSVISRDGRKMVISTHPVRFLMRPETDPTHITPFDADAIDFNTFFSKLNGNDIRVLSALRMNATFPFVLPNVWLPTNPIIDVMDAGLRDNFGQETTLRFLDVFSDWLKENTSKVVVIQIRDRPLGDWDKPYESKSFSSLLTKPLLLLQYNWYRLQDYYQHDQLEYFSDSYGKNFYRICFQYLPSKEDAPASLSFHLTAAEKVGILHAMSNELNKKAFQQIAEIEKTNQ